MEPPLLSPFAGRAAAGNDEERKRNHSGLHIAPGSERFQGKDMHCYCLFCETQRCRRIAFLIEKVHGIRTISPIIMQREWKKDHYHEVPRNWLPGYIFLYSERELIPYFDFLGIIRWVGKGELEGTDLAFAEVLHAQGGIMGTIRLAEEGDRCVVNDPLWEKMQGTIVKLDRGRKRCCIAFDFDNQHRTVWVGYDLVKPVEEQKGGKDEQG